MLMTVMLVASVPTVADDASRAPDTVGPKHVTGTILTVSYTTGDILIYQDSGTGIALYGIHHTRLRDIGAGDRVAVAFGENLEVATIERIEL